MLVLYVWGLHAWYIVYQSFTNSYSALEEVCWHVTKYDPLPTMFELLVEKNRPHILSFRCQLIQMLVICTTLVLLGSFFTTILPLV